MVETNTPLILGWNVESLEKENLSHHHMHCFYNETTKTFLAFTIWVKKEKVRKISEVKDTLLLKQIGNRNGIHILYLNSSLFMSL